MHRWIAGLAALTLSLGPIVSPAAEGTDWVLVRIVAGSAGASGIETGIAATGTADGREAALVGIGFADRWATAVDVIPVGAGPVRLTTTAAAGGVDVVVHEGSGPRAVSISAGLAYDDHLEPSASLALLVFTPGMTLEDIRIDAPAASSGSVSASLLQGTGSRAIAAADPADEGLGAGAGPGAAAFGEIHEETTSAGVVGGFVSLGFCVVCSATWAGPDGDQGSYLLVDGVAAASSEGGSTFAGPAGSWRFTWSGIAVNRAVAHTGRFPAYAAYAPVGDAWTLFRGLGL